MGLKCPNCNENLFHLVGSKGVRDYVADVKVCVRCKKLFRFKIEEI